MSGVDDKVQLHLIDTRQLVEEAQKIREAKKLAQDATKTKKDLAAGVSPLGGGKTSTGAPIGNKNNKPKSFFDSENQTSKGAVGGARTDNAFKQAQQKQKDLENKVAELQKQQDDIKKNQDQLEKDLKAKQDAADKKQLETNETLVGGAQDAIGGLVDPSTIPVLALAILKRFGIVGAVIASALSYVIGPLKQEFEAQFGRGGALDTKLKIPRQALTVNNIDDANSWNDGTKYMTSDLRIVQKAPQSSNTLKISHEAIRYVLDDLGRYS